MNYFEENQIQKNENREIVIANNEIALLGLVMQKNEEYFKVADLIKPEMFHIPAHKIIYQAIADICTMGIELNVSTVVSQLEKTKKLNLISMFGYGPLDYINYIITEAGFSSDINHYAKSILDQYKTDVLTTILKNTSNTIDNKLFNISDLIAKLQLDLINLDISEIQTAWEKVGDKALEVYKDIINNSSDIGEGLNFGFPNLHEVLLGSNPGDLIILGARPAMGKTAFALNIANNVAKAGKNVLFFSLEMSNAQLVQRLISIDSMVSISALRKGYLTPEQKRSILWTVNSMAEWKMLLNDKPSLTIADITTLSRRYAKNNKVDLIIVDYLQLITDSAHAKNDNRQLEVAKISRALKQLARELACPVLSLSQLSRSVEKREDKTPILSDLRESGGIEQDADAIIFLHRPDYYNTKSKSKPQTGLPNEQVPQSPEERGPSITNVIVAKNRHGATATIELLFQAEINKFFYTDSHKDKLDNKQID